MQKVYTKIKVDWESLAVEVSRRLDKEVTTSHVCNVAHGWLKSKRIYEVIAEICPEAIKPRRIA